ncbi:phosphotransferase [Nocardiopsis sp. MG754419]|uniref:phosphotransferase n=1 Tax=Nocardiopsis sp. MG754419 TaxID=2259865 RepID=UPI001BA6F07C|nr:phosphotransferase [Nocardiopsis sp. MG754419]MBR8744796.1 aminoglycoside phosphotransferase family protein [Nocardiopsis sp. MG754419]
MTTYMSAEQRAARTDHAIRTAVEAARDLGLTVTDPRVLHDVFSVVVHLAPAPVVARVPTILPQSTDPDTLAERQRAELDVTRWLAAQGLPVLTPSPLVPTAPVRRDGLSMTFWTYTEQRPNSAPDYIANAESVAALHAALSTYPGPLSFLSSAEPDFVTDAFARLTDHPDLITAQDLDRARAQWDLLEPLVRSRAAFEARFPGIELRPIHGDAPAANIHHGVDGDFHADFELVTLGPVEWDLAALGPDYEAAYDRGARRAGLRPLDADVMAFVNAVGALRAIACLILVPQQPLLEEPLKAAVDHWRGGPAVDTPTS